MTTARQATWVAVAIASMVTLPRPILAAPPPPVDEPATDTPPAEAREAAAPVEAAEPDDAPPKPQTRSAMEHLELAHELRGGDNLAQAEAEVSAAIAVDPHLGTAYLARAQIRSDMAEALADDPSMPASRERAALLRAAAADLETYKDVAELADDAAAFFDARRDALLRTADAIDPPPLPAREEEPEPEPEPDPATALLAALSPVPGLPTPADDPPPPGWPRATSIVGGIAAIGASAFASGALVIRQGCGADGLCAAAWERRPALLAPAAVLAGLGVAAAPLGAYAWSSRAATRRPGRIAGITLLSLSGVTSVIAIVTGSLASGRWRTAFPSDADELRAIQSLANTAGAAIAPTPTLLGAGIAALLGARRAGRERDRGRALGRRTR